MLLHQFHYRCKEYVIIRGNIHFLRIYNKFLFNMPFKPLTGINQMINAGH